jgi:hypothetical protein
MLGPDYKEVEALIQKQVGLFFSTLFFKIVFLVLHFEVFVLLLESRG